MDDPAPRRLCRYTTLPVLMDYVVRREIALLSPASWEDRSDAAICEDYRRQCGASRILAACFTTAHETIHHWSAFAGGPAGCCVEFSPSVLSCWAALPGIRLGPVQYVGLRDQPPAVDLPYRKRLPYRIEAEYRVLAEHHGDGQPVTTALPLPASAWRRITITQRMPESVYASVRQVLRPLLADTAAVVHRSRILDHVAWRTRQVAQA